ncbi:MAG: hypothetical protein GOU99_02765 [Candidatus Altiarchaeota archaeon]|nr:hypothetical protein [Candidatus Altiarchaeota archaeon]
MALCPSFAAALNSCLESFFLGSEGEPWPLLKILAWQANQLVRPTHLVGRSLEMSCRECPGDDGCILDLMREPVRLRKELENFLSPGLLGFSEGLEYAMLGRLPWEKLAVEFPFIWLLGRASWRIDIAIPLQHKDYTRAAFLVVGPMNQQLVLVPAAGKTDSEAEAIGKTLLETLHKSWKDHQNHIHYAEVPHYLVTLSRENKGNMTADTVRLHHLPVFLASRAIGRS